MTRLAKLRLIFPMFLFFFFVLFSSVASVYEITMGRNACHRRWHEGESLLSDGLSDGSCNLIVKRTKCATQSGLAWLTCLLAKMPSVKTMDAFNCNGETLTFSNVYFFSQFFFLAGCRCSFFHSK